MNVIINDEEEDFKIQCEIMRELFIRERKEEMRRNMRKIRQNKSIIRMRQILKEMYGR